MFCKLMNIRIYVCMCVCRGHATESKGDMVYNKDRDGGVILDSPLSFHVHMSSTRKQSALPWTHFHALTAS